MRENSPQKYAHTCINLSIEKQQTRSPFRHVKHTSSDCDAMKRQETWLMPTCATCIDEVQKGIN